MTIPNSPKDFFDMLVQASADGHFPSGEYVPEDDYHNFTCRYRDPNGRKCAIGMLIPDEKYVPDLEDNGTVDVNPAVAQLLPSWLSESDACHIQNCHDFVACSKEGEWDHEEFVSLLREVPLFQNF